MSSSSDDDKAEVKSEETSECVEGFNIGDKLKSCSRREANKMQKMELRKNGKIGEIFDENLFQLNIGHVGDAEELVKRAIKKRLVSNGGAVNVERSCPKEIILRPKLRRKIRPLPMDVSSSVL